LEDWVFDVEGVRGMKIIIQGIPGAEEEVYEVVDFVLITRGAYGTNFRAVADECFLGYAAAKTQKVYLSKKEEK
jgi:hypothetical protein